MNKPLVSIIVPTFNRAYIIVETLNSVLEQTYENWECIIVDDGSDDNIEQLVNSYQSKDSRFMFHIRPYDKRKGANSCRNFGVKKSKGDFLLFLDSDDILKNDCLQTRLEVFEKFPSLDFAVFSMGLIINSQRVNDRYIDLKNANREQLISLFITGPLPWNMTRPFWKRDFFLKYEGFNENLDMFDDDEFNLRVVYDTSIKFKFIDSIDCFYRIYEENVLKDKDSKFVEKIFRSHLLFLKSINQLFNVDDKIKFRKELQKNIYGVMNGYFRVSKVDKSIYKSNVLFFFRNFESPLKFKILIFIKFIFSVYPLDKKGSYKVNKFLNNKIIYTINKC